MADQTLAEKQAARHGHHSRKWPQGFDSKSRLYKIWAGMHQRCRSPKSPSFVRYGARGITVCEQWNTYGPFLTWSMANSYGSELEIDRIENDLGYSPENCRWATRAQQAVNRSNNYFLTAFGETKTKSQWLRDPRCIIKSARFHIRIDRGENPEAVMTRSVPRADSIQCKRGHLRIPENRMPSGCCIICATLMSAARRARARTRDTVTPHRDKLPEKRYITAFGETRRLMDWANDPRCVVGHATLDHRYRRQWTGEAILTTPIRPQALKAATHCLKGHEFTPENTMVELSGARRCRECIRARNRVRKRR